MKLERIFNKISPIALRPWMHLVLRPRKFRASLKQSPNQARNEYQARYFNQSMRFYFDSKAGKYASNGYHIGQDPCCNDFILVNSKRSQLKCWNSNTFLYPIINDLEESSGAFTYLLPWMHFSFLCQWNLQRFWKNFLRKRGMSIW